LANLAPAASGYHSRHPIKNYQILIWNREISDTLTIVSWAAMYVFWLLNTGLGLASFHVIGVFKWLNLFGKGVLHGSEGGLEFCAFLS
jgi:hypothetical protein